MMFNNGPVRYDEGGLSCWACSGWGKPNGCKVCGVKSKRNRLGTAFSMIVMGDDRPRYYPGHDGLKVYCPYCDNFIEVSDREYFLIKEGQRFTHKKCGAIVRAHK